MPPPKEFRDDHTPFGYLITFRCYGTWLHGRPGSVDRSHHTYGTPRLAGDNVRWRYNRRALSQPPVKLKSRQRKLVEAAISETCDVRKWCLWVSNVRSNHVHAVVTANCRPDRVMTALKPTLHGKCVRQSAGILIKVLGLIVAASVIFGLRRH